MLMTAEGYRESLKRYKPRVFVDGRAIESVADAPEMAPGINGVGVTYDFAHRPEHAKLMTAYQGGKTRPVNRMLHINETSNDLLMKLEAVRLVCQESGCAQRYLAHDALNGFFQATKRCDEAHGSDYHQRFRAYLERVQEEDLALGIAMTDAKGDRSKRPAAQANPDVYVHIVERQAKGIVISGTKAIVTGAPYMHELLVMPVEPMRRRTATLPSPAPCRSMRLASPSSLGRPDVRANPRPSSRPSTGNPPALSSSTGSSCPTSGSFWPARRRRGAFSPPPMRPTIVIPVSPPGPDSVIF